MLVFSANFSHKKLADGLLFVIRWWLCVSRCSYYTVFTTFLPGWHVVSRGNWRTVTQRQLSDIPRCRASQ